MATKKRVTQLDRLLSWEREDRLPETKELFNRQISESLSLREIRARSWEIEAVFEDDDGRFRRIQVPLKHQTLVNLGLSILDAIEYIEKRGL